MLTQEDYKVLTELSEKRYTRYYDWIRNLILIAAGLIGILVSLKSHIPNAKYETLTFIISICELGIGILTGSIALYGEIHVLDKARKLCAIRLTEIAKGKTYNLPISTVNKNIFFRIMEWLCFISLLISMISLIAYGILKA